MKLSCASCGNGFEAKRRNARFCSDRCRTRGRRGHLVAVPPVVDEDSTDAAPVGGVTSSTRAALAKAERESTPLGQAALILAARIDSQRDMGSGLAALTREWRATFEAAVAGVAVVGDPVDKLRLVVSERRGT